MILILTGAVAAEDRVDERALLDSIIFGHNEQKLNPLTREELHSLATQIGDGTKTTHKSPEKANKPLSTDSGIRPETRAVFKQLLDLTPAEIRLFNQMQDQRERAKNDPINKPKAISSSEVIDLSPGSSIPELHLLINNSTSIAFIDATGEPWPIEDHDRAIEEVFHITNPETQQHIIKLSPKKSYAFGNLSLTLKDLMVPVVIQLVAGYINAVDVRKEYHIAARGPNAKQQSDPAPNIMSRSLLDFLDGVPPTDARIIHTDNDTIVQLWELNQHYYIKTKGYLLLPAPLAKRQSTDGTYIYKTQKMPSLNISFNGIFQQITIQE